MKYRWEKYFLPVSLKEALELIDVHRDHVKVIAGGTDLIVSLEKKDSFIAVIVDISRISELKGISVEKNAINIGAGVTLSAIEQSETVRKHVPFLAKAVHQIGSPQIRNIATLVGNVANASPAADGVLPLLALDSTVTLLSESRGERKMPLSMFLIGPGKTSCNPEELITGVQFPVLDVRARGSFEKVGLRKAMNISIANVSIIAEVVDGKAKNSRIALGAVGPTAMRVLEAERALNDQSINEEETTDTVSDLCMQGCTPIDDLRGSAAYRKKIVRALVKRCLKNLSSPAQEPAA